MFSDVSNVTSPGFRITMPALREEVREAAVRARRPSRKDEVRDDLHCERQGRADGGIHRAGEELCVSTPKDAGSYGQILQARRSLEVMSGFTVSRAVDDAVTVRPEDVPSGSS
jgi:hypothetical protein